MRIEAFGGADVDAGVRAQPLADEVRMHRRRGEHAGDRDAIRPDIFVGEENLALALAHRLFGLVADALDRGAQRLRPATGFEGAIDLGRGGGDRKSTRLNSSPYCAPRMPSSA